MVADLALLGATGISVKWTNDRQNPMTSIPNGGHVNCTDFVKDQARKL